jgi:hypothetical protein
MFHSFGNNTANKNDAGPCVKKGEIIIISVYFGEASYLLKYLQVDTVPTGVKL